MPGSKIFKTKRIMNKKRIFFGIKLFIILYCLTGIYLYYTQDKFLLHPQTLPTDYTFQFNHSFQEIIIPINKEDTINMVRFTPADDTVSKGAVLYLHGNTGNIVNYAPEAEQFLKHNYEVWMPDYPGFGKSRGVFTEKNVNEAIFQVKRFMNTRFSDSNIIVYGKSLGTGIAASLASNLKVKYLILEAPYFSIPDLFWCRVPFFPMSAMSNYKIPTGEYISEATCPVTVFHGTDDEVIPLKCAEKIKPFMNSKDQFVLISKGKHNDLTERIEYKKVMNKLLQ